LGRNPIGQSYYTNFKSAIILNERVDIGLFYDRPYALLQRISSPLFFDILPTQEVPYSTYEFLAAANAVLALQDPTLFFALMLIDPYDTETNVGIPVVFDWSTVPDCTIYNVQVATDVNFANIVESIWTSNTSYESAVVTYDDTYYWRVRGGN
jgi:hypothetical protein